VKIPVYENKVQQNQGKSISPSNYQPAQISLDSNLSGSAYDTAAAKLGGVVFDIAEKVGDHLIQMKKEDNQKAVMDADTSFQREVDENVLSNFEEKIIDNPTTGEQIPVKTGIYNRQGVAAYGAFKDYRTVIEPIKQKYLNNAENDWQRENLQVRLNKYDAEVGSRVLSHESKEREKSYYSSVNSNIQQDLANAGNFAGNVDAALVNFNGNDKIIGIKQKLRDPLYIRGKTKEEIDVAEKKLAKEYVSNLLLASKSSTQMNSLIEAFKNILNKDDYDAFKKTAEGKNEKENHFSLWKQLENDPDVIANNQGKVLGEIRNNPKYGTLEQRLKTSDSIEAYMKEKNSQAVELAKMNTKNLEQSAQKMYDEGRSVDEAEEQLSAKFVNPNLPTDPQIRANKNHIRSKWDKFEPASITAVENDLFEAIHNGDEQSYQKVNAAVEAKQINSKSKIKLYNELASGRNPLYTTNIDIVKSIAKKATGKKQGDPRFDSFVAKARELSGGDPSKLPEAANSLLQEVSGTGKTFFGMEFRKKHQYELLNAPIEQALKNKSPSKLEAPSMISTPSALPAPTQSPSAMKSDDEIKAILKSRGNVVNDFNINRAKELIRAGQLK
jgi:hypothetical protein